MISSRMMLVLFSVVLLGASTVSALDLKDARKVPGWYAREAEVTDPQGRKQKQAVYGTLSYAASGEEWNQILSAYGVTLKDIKKVPSWFGRETEVTDQQGRKQKQIAYGTATAAATGEECNQIFSAYGLTLADVKKVPSWYGRETEVTDPQGRKQKQVVYGTTSYFITPEELNQILGAYR